VVERALVVSLQGIGNALLALPAAKALNDAGYETDLITLSPRLLSVLEHAPFLHAVFTAGHARYQGLTGRLRLLTELRRRAYDVAIFSYPSGKNAYRFLRLTGARRRVGHRYPEVGGAWRHLTDALPPEPHTHDLQHNLALLAHLGVPASAADLWPIIRPSARLQDNARNYLAEQGLDPLQLYFGLHTGCDGQWVEKRWPESHFARLAEMVHERFGLTAIVLDGPGEPGSGRKVARLAKTPVHALDGRGDLADAWGVLFCCKFMASNDSGLMNLAAASGIPTVAVFGPSQPHRTQPFGPRGRAVITDRTCAPCYGLGSYSGCPFPNEHCLQALAPEQVFDAIVDLVRP
jgi:ADP-heptose:LPS heptosyltransferase